MKLSILLLALFLSSLTVRPPAIEAETTTYILDIDGHRLQPGVEYYILPVFRGRGGGLTLASRNGSCPLNVAQEDMEVSQGLPLKFFPVDSRLKVISLSMDMNIVFSAATICEQSTVWRVGQVNGATGRRYVVTGGVTGNPGRETVNNWFKIDKYGDDYKLVFCPSVCSICRIACGDVGVFIEDGKRWLGLSDQPLPVMFKKV